MKDKSRNPIKLSYEQRKERIGYIFISPFFIIFLIFGLYPIIYTIYLSFHSWNGLTDIVNIGTSNFKRLLGDKVFYTSLVNTFRMWMFNFIPQLLTALLLSCLFSLSRLKGKGFFRAAYYLPNLITAASVGLLFNLLFGQPNCAANQFLMKCNIINAPIKFLEIPSVASGMVSYIQWWMWFGYTTVLVMAGISTIDQTLYEAARIDGAGKFKIFWYITIPLIRPTLVYIIITSIISGMQLFDVPATLTDGLGAPQKSLLTTSMYIYTQGFKYHNYGYASTVSVGLFLIIVFFSIFAFMAMKRKNSYN